MGLSYSAVCLAPSFLLVLHPTEAQAGLHAPAPPSVSLPLSLQDKFAKTYGSFKIMYTVGYSVSLGTLLLALTILLGFRYQAGGAGAWKQGAGAGLAPAPAPARG